MANISREMLVLFCNHPSVHRMVRFKVHMDQKLFQGAISSKWFRKELMALLCQNYKGDQFYNVVVYDVLVDYGFSFTAHPARVALRELTDEHQAQVAAAKLQGKETENIPMFHIALEELPPLPV